MNGADDAPERAHDPVRGKGAPERVGPREHPGSPSRKGHETAMDPELTGANVMLVNKPRAGHPGTTQEQTRPAGRARVYPKPGRRIRKPKSVLGGGGFREGGQVHCPYLGPR